MRSCWKERAIEVLKSCSPDIIWRFINQSWWFIDAYKMGLTGEAVAWVVHKQKGYRSVSEAAMKVLEAREDAILTKVMLELYIY